MFSLQSERESPTEGCLSYTAVSINIVGSKPQACAVRLKISLCRNRETNVTCDVLFSFRPMETMFFHRYECYNNFQPRTM